MEVIYSQLHRSLADSSRVWESNPRNNGTDEARKMFAGTESDPELHLPSDPEFPL